MDERDEILVIDDDEGTRKTLALILTKKGFDVVTAGTGEEGLKKAQGRKVAVALLDINLPDIEGIRLIAPLKEITPDLAVIMITGFASMENAMRALNEGATGYVLKPVNIDEILLKIHDALERQHLIKSKQQAEEALRLSEEKYRNLVENINDVIYSLDEKGIITYISPVIEKISGYPPSHLTGHPFAGFIVKDDLPGVMQAFEAGMKDTITSFPFRIVTKSGDQKWLSVSSHPAFTNGNLSGIQGVLSDITERKRAEEALWESREHYRAFIDHSQLAIAVLDVNFKIIMVNARFSELFKKPVEDFVGKYCFNEFEKRTSVCTHCPGVRAMVSGKSEEVETVGMLDDGSRFSAHNRAVPFFGPDGALKGFVEMVEDITERKRIEDALRESEQKFRDIFNNTTDAIHIHGIGDDGSPGRFSDLNDVTWRMLGYTKEEMLAKTPLDIATDYHNPPIEKILEAQRTTGNARFETEYRRKDGTVIPVEVNTHVVTIQGKKVMLGVVRDITERKKAEALLKHYSEELEQEVKVRTEELSASLDEKVVLLREVHHRVKNNLQIIISLVNLQMRQIDDERLKQVMAETQNRVRAMAFVHEKLYQSEDISHIDIANYTRFLVTQLFSFYGVYSRQVTLNVDIGKLMQNINTAIPLGLIINELASNALKHAFPNGRTGSLSITVREEDTTLYLTVKDDGVGIPEDFDWRNAESLGLRLVISLVDQLDGTIELDRRAGTAFTIVVQEKE